MKKSNFSASTSLFLALFMIIQLVLVTLFLGACDLSNGDTEASVQSQDPTETVYGVEKWIDYYSCWIPEEYETEPLLFSLPEFAGITLAYDKQLTITKCDGSVYSPVCDHVFSVFFADVTGDQKRDVCIGYYTIPVFDPELNVYSNKRARVCVYDIANETEYDIGDEFELPRYILRIQDDKLYVIGDSSVVGYTTIYDLSVKEGGLSLTEADVDWETYVALVNWPFHVDYCVYYFEETVDMSNISLDTQVYYPLNDNEKEILSNLLKAAEWKKGEEIDSADGYIFVKEFIFYFNNDGDFSFGNKAPTNAEEISEFLQGFKNNAFAWEPSKE